MKCAIDCVEYLYEYYDFDVYNIKKELQNKITKNGLCVYDVISVSNLYGLKLKAYRSFFFINENPCILLLRSKHFVVLIRKSFLYSVIWDKEYGIIKINNLKLFVLFSHVSLVCYNYEKERRR